MEFLSNYGMFLAQAVTVVISILIVVGGVLALGSKGGKGADRGDIKVTYFNETVEDMEKDVQSMVLTDDQLKALAKSDKKKSKEEKKEEKKKEKSKKSPGNEEAESKRKKRLFVLDFDGDIRASAVEHLRHEITAVLTIATEQDEVVVRLESGGGMVHSYGYASSQLQRIKDKGVPLTVCVDMVAASGGYMMACIANKILSAPFAIVGSIGVVAQIPNFHRILKKNDIDVELLTAGEYKRTLTMFGENTDKGREKFVEDLEDTHLLFKEFVQSQRDAVKIDEVATGDHWFGIRAKELNLVDDLITSDQYLVAATEKSDVYEVEYEIKKSFMEKVGVAVQLTVENSLMSLWSKLSTRYFS